nr:MAG TPA: hypothetical protein [Caudoviricetes sp.]
MTTRARGLVRVFRPSCPVVLRSCCVSSRGLTCCKARRRPLGASLVSRTDSGLKSSQNGSQRVSGVSGTGW